MQKMISGRGQLKINGEPMGIAFNVPEGPCLPEAILPDMQRFANQLTDLAAARAVRAGHRISCAKGCGACCRQMVPVSPPEARHLAALVDRMPADRALQVRSRFQSARETVTTAGLTAPGAEDADQASFRSFGLAWFALGVPCPFLENESCSIHADRPLVCREYLVTSPPAACASPGAGGIRQIAVPRRLWAIFSRITSATGTLEWMPLTSALDHAATHETPEPHRAGPHYVEALLDALKS